MSGPVCESSVLNCVYILCLLFSRLESKVQKLESQQRGELEGMKEEKNRLQVQSITVTSVCFTLTQHAYTVDNVWITSGTFL